jgi:hypothetical protein
VSERRARTFSKHLVKKTIRLQKKKEQGFRPAPKIVSTLFSRKFGFDLD